MNRIISLILGDFLSILLKDVGIAWAQNEINRIKFELYKHANMFVLVTARETAVLHLINIHISVHVHYAI